MLTGEYAVLDGAQAIALPTQRGQSLTSKQTKGSDIDWKSYDDTGNLWFSAKISLYDFSAVKTTDEAIAENLRVILKNAVRLNSEFLSKWNGFKVETRLEFPTDWGLGSSSSLTSLVAQWADVHPLLLHFKFSNGSGYDVACAEADGPIAYQYKNGTINWEEVNFNPSFKKNLNFVYLGNKQSTKEGIDFYNKKVKSKKSFVSATNELSDAYLTCKSLKSFKEIIDENEILVSKVLKMERCKEKFFSDFEGSIKSLGAWGGDFVMTASEKPFSEVKSYFADKGLEVCIPYDDFIL